MKRKIIIKARKSLLNKIKSDSYFQINDVILKCVTKSLPPCNLEDLYFIITDGIIKRVKKKYNFKNYKTKLAVVNSKPYLVFYFENIDNINDKRNMSDFLKFFLNTIERNKINGYIAEVTVI